MRRALSQRSACRDGPRCGLDTRAIPRKPPRWLYASSSLSINTGLVDTDRRAQPGFIRCSRACPVFMRIFRGQEAVSKPRGTAASKAQRERTQAPATPKKMKDTSVSNEGQQSKMTQREDQFTKTCCDWERMSCCDALCQASSGVLDSTARLRTRNLSTTNTSFAIPALLTTTALFASKTAILNRQEAIVSICQLCFPNSSAVESRAAVEEQTRSQAFGLDTSTYFRYSTKLPSFCSQLS